jgi:molecular chaperone GrpE
MSDNINKDSENIIQEEEESAEQTESAIETDNNINAASLQEQITDLMQRNLRLIADMQNTQRRQQEDLKKMREYAISEFAKDVLNIKDYLDMALKDQTADIELLKAGITLTLQQLNKVLDSQQIKEINPVAGTKLDPNLHQAMELVADHTQTGQTIIAVLQKGYLLRERILRPAFVSVAA